MAYYKLEPFGAERDNWHAAQISSILVNSRRKKGTAPVPVSEFMYRDRYTVKETETKQFLAGMQAIAKPKKAPNGKD